MNGEESVWPVLVTLAQARRRHVMELAPDAAARGAIARSLGLEALEALTAEVELRPWMDGASLAGRWRAEVVQICGVSLDPFPTSLQGEFLVHVLPPDSPHAPPPVAEVVIDPEAEDPPDVLDGETIDVGAYLIEHLALEIDPFPRKPGVEFEPPEELKAPSPFDVLRNLPRA